jgi:hypothetical protein
MIRHGVIAAALAGVLCMTSASAAPQTPAAATARTAKAGDPAAAPTPKLQDGHPDLNGTWDNGRSAFGFAPNAGGSTCVFGCAPAAGGGRGNAGANAQPQRGTARPAYKPEFIAKMKDLDERQVKEDPALKCRPPGVPRIGPPDKIVQRSSEIVFLYDDVSGNFFRIVPTDGHSYTADPATWRTEPEDGVLGHEGTRERLGLIAEEVETVIPSAVTHDRDGKTQAIDYAQVTVALLDHVQRLTDEVATLRYRISELEGTS